MNTFTPIISEALGLSQRGVENTLQLLDENCTIPFISRYRKEMTGNMDEVQVSDIAFMREKLTDIAKRKETILSTIESQGKLSDDLRKRIDNCWTLSELEDIYLPYKPKRRTKADIARQNGLEPLANAILLQLDKSISRTAERFVKGEVKSVAEALEGAKFIIAEAVNENESVRKAVRAIYRREAVISSKAVKAKADAEEAQKADSEGQEQQTETDKKEKHSEKEQVREPETEATEVSQQEKPEKSKIYVDICGAVVNPGVFQFEEGSRVFQAIEAAGGFLPEAAQTCVNRAGILTDGEQLYILTREEQTQMNLKPGQSADGTGQIQETAGGTVTGEGLEQNGKVNINTADESGLTTLSGIGDTRAKAIIAYREENGPFATIEDIMNVSGIKEGTFEKIKDDIVVG